MRKSILFMLGISLFSMTACSNGDKKEVKSKASSSTVISVNKESSGNTKKNESNSITKTSNVVSSTSVEKTQMEVSLADFIGGWGIPQSGNLFFINEDGTYSNGQVDHSSLIDLKFSILADGRKSMSSNLGTLIKESDGTLTDGELVFQPLEFSNKEDFLADKQKEYKNSPETNAPENEVEITNTIEDITNGSISTDTNTLTGFLNVYGMSPAAYKVTIEGMSEEEALRNTPKEMKTSAEIQLGISKYGIQ
ncbi:DUF4950 domain-containing protein [Enterococcus faecalis]|uniref:DUF4950 domain-containing protein n=2 Tax=Enterococcus faecalis TaxID=1351 RepID=Q835F7_ENTFA|nr:DUF4950 domain-containing protein [Enterococcus faecalis]AAO81211.1 hypothetical protein EF_1420 [Enterococcus faecalis V583]EOI10854.1 hypothetical protein UCK_01165 [Enterococcus faecalis EnGen0242]EOK40037.1 hypothetical protein WUG_01852 [Enterococcus faecalis EnGen0332]EOL76535.1 hypothetical protein UM3_01448 [Enterococcus faecalis EnGen0307]EOT50286.1 hypothetical protein OO5_02052 [Enterococcus faecalis V583]